MTLSESPLRAVNRRIWTVRFVAKAPRDLEPVQARQHDIQDDEVRPAGGCGDQRARPIGRGSHR